MRTPPARFATAASAACPPSAGRPSSATRAGWSAAAAASARQATLRKLDLQDRAVLPAPADARAEIQEACLPAVLGRDGVDAGLHVGGVLLHPAASLHPRL